MRKVEESTAKNCAAIREGYKVSQCSSWKELRVLLDRIPSRKASGGILNGLDVLALVVGLGPSYLQPCFVQ